VKKKKGGAATDQLPCGDAKAQTRVTALGSATRENRSSSCERETNGAEGYHGRVLHLTAQY